MSCYKSLPTNILTRIAVIKNKGEIIGCKDLVNDRIRKRDHPLFHHIYNEERELSNDVHYCDIANFLLPGSSKDSLGRVERGLNVTYEYDENGEITIAVSDESYDGLIQCHNSEDFILYEEYTHNYRGMYLCLRCFLIYYDILSPEHHMVDDEIILSAILTSLSVRRELSYEEKSYWDWLPNDTKKEILYWKCIAEVRDRGGWYLSDITDKNHDLILDNYWIQHQWEHNRNRIDNYGRQRFFRNYEWKHCEFNQLIETFDWDQGISAFNLDTDRGVELFKEIFCLPETWVCTYGSNQGPDIIRRDAVLSYDISHDYRGYKVCIYCYRNAIAAEWRVWQKEVVREMLKQPYNPPDDYISKLRHDNGDYFEGQTIPLDCYCDNVKKDLEECKKCYRDYCQYMSKLNLAVCRKEMAMKRTLTRQVLVARIKYNQRNNLLLDTTIEDYRIPHDPYCDLADYI